MLEEQDVVIRARGGHRVPGDFQSFLSVIRFDHHVEDAHVVGLADLRLVGQGGGQLLAGFLIAGRAEGLQEHGHHVTVGHGVRFPTRFGPDPAGLRQLSRRSSRRIVTPSPASLPMALRVSAFTGSLWVPSPIAMNELRKGWPSIFPRTLTRPRVWKNSTES